MVTHLEAINDRKKQSRKETHVIPGLEMKQYCQMAPISAPA
jgi:hypothetical protein